MARGKKKEILTRERCLHAALVPEGEQPYQAPGNWCWVRLGLLLQASKEKTDKFSDVNLKYVGLEHMQKDVGIVAYGSAVKVKSLKNIFHPQQILYGKLRPYLNKHDVATFDGVCSTDILVFNTTSACIPEFINFFLDQDTFIQYAVSNSKGINLPRISETVVLDAKCPLPPLPEQQRIVDRLESLFTKLDEAKQRAQDALDSFETRKAAILHTAFTGKLTAQWRKKHGVGMESWVNLSLKDVATWGSGGTPSKNIPEYYAGNIPWVKTGELNDDYLYKTEEHISAEAINHSSAKVYPAGTVVLAMYGATIGKCAILGIKAATNQACACAIPNKNLYSRFLFYYLLSQRENFIRLGKGGAQPNISQAIIKQYPIMHPSCDEQMEIIRILDDLFAKEQQAKEAIEAVLKQINLIKKAILVQAFRGELGTNDPSEESSIGLLEQSISEIIAMNEVVPKQEIKSKIEVVFVPKTIMEALPKGVRLTPEELKSETGLPIDDFYEQLKALIDNGSVAESRENGNSYLEAVNENRQTENRQL